MKNRHFSKDGNFFVLKGGVYGLEVKINKEIRNYTESMFFGLSMRQFLFPPLPAAYFYAQKAGQN